jgi:hypothetical protein
MIEWSSKRVFIVGLVEYNRVSSGSYVSKFFRNFSLTQPFENRCNAVSLYKTCFFGHD